MNQVDTEKQAGSTRTLTYAVRVISPAGKESPGEVQLVIWGKRDRVKRALKAFGFCWGLAVVAVFIPGLHFILVPSLLIAGPFAAHFTFKQRNKIAGGQSICPECGQALPLIGGQERWPFSDLCAGCQTAVKVDRVAEVTGS